MGIRLKKNKKIETNESLHQSKQDKEKTAAPKRTRNSESAKAFGLNGQKERMSLQDEHDRESNRQINISQKGK